MRKDCAHERTFEIHGKPADRFTYSYNDGDWSEPDYAPYIGGLCGGDDIQVKICLDCHQVLDFSSEDVEILIEDQAALEEEEEYFSEEEEELD